MTTPSRSIPTYAADVEYDGELHTPPRTYGMSKAAATWAGMLVSDFVIANVDFFDQGQRQAVEALLDRLGDLTDDDFGPAELDLRACCDHPAHAPGGCPVTGPPHNRDLEGPRTCDCDGHSPSVAVDWAPGTQPPAGRTLTEPGSGFVVHLRRFDPA